MSFPHSASVGQILALCGHKEGVSSKLGVPGSVCQMLLGHTEHRRSFSFLGSSKILSFHAFLPLLESDQRDNMDKPQRKK